MTDHVQIAKQATTTITAASIIPNQTKPSSAMTTLKHPQLPLALRHLIAKGTLTYVSTVELLELWVTPRVKSGCNVALLEPLKA